MTVRVKNGDAPAADQQAPPWSNVDPWALIGQLQAQLAAQATEAAAMRVYIAQLHEALAQVADQETTG